MSCFDKVVVEQGELKMGAVECGGGSTTTIVVGGWLANTRGMEFVFEWVEVWRVAVS